MPPLDAGSERWQALGLPGSYLKLRLQHLFSGQEELKLKPRQLPGLKRTGESLWG